MTNVKIRLLTVLVTSIILAATASSQTTSGVFPQIVTGNGWSTEFIISNTSSTANGTFTLDFYDTSGKPMGVSLNIAPANNSPIVPTFCLSSGPTSVFCPGTPTQSVTIIVGARQTYSLATIPSMWPSPGWAYPALQQGYATVTNTNTLNLKCVVTYQNGTSISESVTSTLPSNMNNYGIPFDNTNGFSTGIAWVNSDMTNTLGQDIAAWDENGVKIVDEIATLCPGCQQTFSVGIRFPQTAGKKGMLVFFSLSSSVSKSNTVVAFRFNPLGSFTTMDTFPVTE
jgi:hypothetical protein